MSHAFACRMACGALLLLAGCASTGVPTLLERPAPIRGASDERELLRIAEDVEMRVLRGERLYEDPRLAAYVQSVAHRLLLAAGAPAAVKVRTRVTRAATPDAFVLANGALYVSLGLLARLENEAQLAALVGHELTHYLRRDTLRMERAGRDVQYTRALEIEADGAGLELMAAAGYRPDQTTAAYRRLLEAIDVRRAAGLARTSSHPQLAERVAGIEAQVTALCGSACAEGYVGRETFASRVGEILVPVSAQEALAAPSAP